MEIREGGKEKRAKRNDERGKRDSGKRTRFHTGSSFFPLPPLPPLSLNITDLAVYNATALILLCGTSSKCHCTTK